MEQYTKTAYSLAKSLTQDYSTSFSSSSRLFDKAIQPHIYAIYALVRIADEIVDTYQGDNMLELLNTLEDEVLELLRTPTTFSSNPIIHAFITTAKKYKISNSLITPFFESMRSDITKSNFTRREYDTYIYGSAEVIGLMCLKVFCEGDEAKYKQLKTGAQALGSAYQKVNFLRDIAADFSQRDRWYFPIGSFETFNDTVKKEIEADIEANFKAALPSLQKLPASAKKALQLSYDYYYALFQAIQKASATTLTTKRIRVPNNKKAALFIKAAVK